MSPTSELSSKQVVLPPEVSDRMAFDDHLRFRLVRTLEFWKGQLHEWELEKVVETGFQFYSLSRSEGIKPRETVLTVHPQYRRADSGQYSPRLDLWTSQTVIITCGTSLDETDSTDTITLKMVPEKDPPPSRPEITVSALDAKGEPDSTVPHPQAVAKVLSLLDDRGNLIPVTRLADTVEDRGKHAIGHNRHVQTLLRREEWDGLSAGDKKRRIDQRVKALKALAKFPILRRQTMEEMKWRFLANRREKALTQHPINHVLVRGLTPSVYFDLFSDELDAGYFPGRWLVEQLQTISQIIEKMNQHNSRLTSDMLRWTGAALAYTITNGGDVFQDARLDNFVDSAMILYSAQKMYSLITGVGNYPDDLPDYEEAAERLKFYLGNR